MPSNLPLGVTNTEPNAPWEHLYECIDNDAAKAKMSDMDAWSAWRLGLAAFKAARDMSARFNHDES